VSDRSTQTDCLPCLPDVSVSPDVTDALLRTRALDPPQRPGLAGSLDGLDILGVIGKGGMCVVLLAREAATGAQLAVKLLRPELIHEPRIVRRFLTEAKHMSQLDHPNVLRVLTVSDRSAGPYYTMPYKERGSLANRLTPDSLLNTQETIEITAQVADALAYTHAQGIIHRDVKPHNILLDADNHAHLADFGLGRTVYNDTLIEPGKEGRLGTVAYMSPAVATGEAEDTRCDIYSFGAVLYEMLTGEPPYTGQTHEAIIQQIIAGPPIPIRSRNPKAPSGLTTVAEGCMARELRDRYASIKDVVRDLHRIREGKVPLGPHGRKPRRHGLLATVVAALVLLTGWGVWHFTTKPAQLQPTGTSAAVPVFGWDFNEATNRYAEKTGALSAAMGTGTTTVVGISGNAVSFPSSQTAYVDLGTFDLPEEQGGLEMWLRPEAFDSKTHYHVLVKGHHGHGPSGWAFGFRIYSDGSMSVGSGLAGDRYARSEGGIIEPGKWQHVLATWRPEGVAFYVDGVLAKTAEARGTVRAAAHQDMPVGLAKWGALYYPETAYKGDIDQVRIYDRALGADEIALVARRQWTRMFSGTAVEIRRVWGSGPSDVFAVGRSGLVLHYDGSTWSPMASGAPLAFNAVWGSGPNDVYAVTGERGHGGRYHFDGSKWTSLGKGPGAEAWGVWATSPNEVFAVGKYGIMRYDGSTWSSMPCGLHGYGFEWVWGSGPKDVFAVGHSTIMHYDGTKWKLMLNDNTKYFHCVWGSGPNDVYVVGFTGPNWASASGLIMHYDGQAWSPVRTDTTTSDYISVWGSGPKDVFVVGVGGKVLHYDGTDWSPMESGTTLHLLGVWGNGSNDVYVVGEGGTILNHRAKRNKRSRH